MEKYKKIIPFIQFKYQTAYIGNTEIPSTVEELCKNYDDGGADALLILDESQSPEEHEKVLASIKTIAAACMIPIIAGGQIHHIDDIKKYLYAGASCVLFRASDDASLIKEGQKRFGSERCALYFESSSELKQVDMNTDMNITDLVGQIYLNGSEAENRAYLNKPWFYGTVDTEVYLFASSPEMQAECLKCFDGIFTDISVKEAGLLMEKKHYLKGQGILLHVFEAAFSWKDMKQNADAMVPVIVQDYQTDEVLMLAYMNQEAYENTIRTGRMTYYSRSRQELWVKGETSGHYQYVKTLKLDCDNDTILAQVSQVGAACHTGNKSCFYREIMSKGILKTNPLKVFEDVFSVIQDRKIHPREGSYTNYLYEKGLDKILKKVGEEATEIVIAAKNPQPEETTYEIADFLYHVMVLMAEKGITWEDVTRELANR